MFKRFLLYALRWQLSTPILTPVVMYSEGIFFPDNPSANYWLAVAVANFIGSCIFFWVDKFIFRPKLQKPLWELQDNTTCFDCGKGDCRCYRLVRAKNYDRLDDKKPEFRCEACSEKRAELLKKNGVDI